VREASRILRETPRDALDYVGFVEGDDIGKGTADVVVTEGFAKITRSNRGRHRQAVRQYLRSAKAGRPDGADRLPVRARRSGAREDRPRRSSVFLGLNGIVIEPRRHRRGRVLPPSTSATTW
jgi:glycerol-3-phosphate acyltransferase PlsX